MTTDYAFGAVVYDSLWERLFSFQSLEGLLSFGALFSAVAFPFFAWRWFPFRDPYFSKLLLIALCPFIGAAIPMVLRVNHFLKHEAPEPGYIIGRLGAPVQIAMWGMYVSLAAVCVYSAAYAVSKKLRNA